MKECRFCHEDLSHLPAEANIFPHRIGLCTPTHNEVDACLLEIEEAEKERTRRAIEYVNAQRPRPHAKRNVLLGILAGLCIWVAGVLAVILWKSL